MSLRIWDPLKYTFFISKGTINSWWRSGAFVSIWYNECLWLDQCHCSFDESDLLSINPCIKQVLYGFENIWNSPGMVGLHFIKIIVHGANACSSTYSLCTNTDILCILVVDKMFWRTSLLSWTTSYLNGIQCQTQVNIFLVIIQWCRDGYSFLTRWK